MPPEENATPHHFLATKTATKSFAYAILAANIRQLTGSKCCKQSRESSTSLSASYMIQIVNGAHKNAEDKSSA